MSKDDDIVVRLRVETSAPFPLMNEAADEIERLRGLVTDWADAQDKRVSDGGYDPRNIKWPEVDTALRKEVGR